MHIHTIQLNIEKVVGGTLHMDATEFGAYMSLLISCYQAKNKLPDDDSRLCRMAKCSPKVWKRIRDVVSQKFLISDGYWTHLGVQKELERIHLLSTKNRANRLKNKETEQPVVKPKSKSGSTNTNNKEQGTIIDTKVSIKFTHEDLTIDHVSKWLMQKRIAGKYLTIDEHALLEMFKDYCRAKNPKYKDYVAAFRNSFNWDNAPKIGETNGRSKSNTERNIDGLMAWVEQER